MVQRSVQAATLDRASGVPLWTQLVHDISRRLEAGAFVTRFPGEYQLVEEYGVSRHTVREALRRLRDDGVLESSRGRGTRVHTPRIEQPVGALYSLFRAVEALGIEQRSEVRALELRTEPRAASRLGLPVSTEFVYLERLRLADGEPLAVDHAWLPRDVAEPLLDADFTHAALYDELARRAGVKLTGGREQIQAIVPAPALRATLGIGRTVAVFAIERQGVVKNRPVEWRESMVRGDRFSLTADWTGRCGYQLGVTGSGAAPATESTPESAASQHLKGR